MYTWVVKDGNSPLRFATRQLKNTFFGCFVQCVHFKHFAPEPKETAVNRYDFEAWRHWKIVDDQLAKHRYVLGADSWGKLPNVKRLLDEIDARPAAQCAEAIKSRHEFKTEFEDAPRKALFPQNARLNAN